MMVKELKTPELTQDEAAGIRMLVIVCMNSLVKFGPEAVVAFIVALVRAIRMGAIREGIPREIADTIPNSLLGEAVRVHKEQEEELNKRDDAVVAANIVPHDNGEVH